ncbi:hypothetical protein [Brevundimonas sp.]|uniref:hypothetical protein n=1 Tax=Brevundimonas sp. TaxID=1871086 RepID=UPI0025BB4D0B|nr:hypothetical protein [Brevundimonas sp.]
MSLSFKPDATPRAELLHYCESDSQRAVIQALIDTDGNVSAAARKLGQRRGGFQQTVARVKALATVQGYAPDYDLNHAIPSPMVAKGHSTLYGADGEVKLQWVKTKLDDDRRLELIREAIAAMTDDVPRAPPLPAPGATADHLCNLYTLTDSHVGMLAWRKEGGADWDLNIAEQTLTGCFEQMVLSSPAATTCVVNQLGDWLHSDGLLPVTPTSGHVLDQDGRFSKMVGAAIRILRRVIDMALAKHQTVFVVMAEGNHDLASSVWLRLMFAALYESEPRVKVIDSELPYYVHLHGEVMLAFHHGHLKKNEALPLLFAAQYPREWGATTKRYAHCGHRHHEEVKEHSGMKVVQHSTLAARDAYAARGGWMSERQATAYTYHARWGQVGSVTVTPEMLV